MDLLDRVLDGAGRDLLARVDAALVAGGAPADHPIWPLARAAGALPGDAVESLAALRPAPLLTCATHLRALAEGYAAEHAALTTIAGSGGWEGAASEAFRAQVRGFAAHLGTDEGMTGRLVATVSYVDDVAAWIADTRRSLAGILAEVVASAEAVRLRTGVDATGSAAVVGARVLDGVTRALAAGLEVERRWAGRLDEVAYRPLAETGVPRLDTTTRVGP